MKKTSLIKLLCLVVFCALLVPMIIACDGETPEPTQPSTQAPKVTVTFMANGGSLNGFGRYVEVEKNQKIPVTQIPEPTRTGYEFIGWAYDTTGNDMWSVGDTIPSDTVLTAIWREVAGGPTGGSNNTDNSGTTGGSNTTGSSDNTQGGGENTPPAAETVTIRFNTGSGYFEDNKYTYTVEKGGYFSGALPTPSNDDPSQKFDNWYKDELCTKLASRSDAYTEDTTLYAKWTTLTECADGSYSHDWDIWEDGDAATCTTYGTLVRLCKICNSPDTKLGAAPKGHQYGSWTEAFMRKERTCTRLGCGDVEVLEYKNVTTAVLGNDPAAQIEGTADRFYTIPFTALINDAWDEGFGKAVSPKSAEAEVIFSLVEATTLDRIYFKCTGPGVIEIHVQYEGDDTFTLLGQRGASNAKEDTPYVEVDNTRKVSKVRLFERNVRNGETYWQEVAFVKVVNED